MTTVHSHVLPNGLTLVGEEMEHVSSAALSILVPLGAATDPRGQEGITTLLAEMVNRGAGPWSNRGLCEEYEKIGVHRSHAAGIEVTVFSGALLGENLPRALNLFATTLLAPHLPSEELENVRQLALQDLKSLEDEPSSKVMVELAKRFYPEPYGRCQLGTVEGLGAVTPQSLVRYYRESFVPECSVLGVAGRFDWEQVKSVVGHEFGNWQGKRPGVSAGSGYAARTSHHIARDTNQLQIALAYPSVAFDHPDYYAAKVAVGVLSGGMAGRLFVEVREKRGLVYRVSASHSAAKGRAAVFCYAGTTPERAEETLAVMISELRGVRDGVSEEELKRAKADLKSRIIMQGELSSVRASSIVNDWWNIGRVRSLDEIKAAIDRVSDADIRRHLHEYPVDEAVLVALGPKPLMLPAVNGGTR